MIEKYYSRGKLLLTAEYLVLQGAKALALPVSMGQSIEIKSTNSGQLNWLTVEQEFVAFSASFKLHDFSILSSSNNEKAIYISNLLRAIQTLSPKFLGKSKGCEVLAQIEFNMQWGLGTSSTLINNLAQWSKVNPFELNNLVSKGSGYDIACAAASTPILYQITANKPTIKPVLFKPPFLNNLTLVYLNKKMATENNIQKFLKNSIALQAKIDEVNILTQNFLECTSLDAFIDLITEHENLIGSILQQTPVKQLLFADFEGGIKSLGAWGGDFVLTASENNFEKQCKYFNNKGYATVIPLKEFIELK